jgi:hypothetical protein
VGLRQENAKGNSSTTFSLWLPLMILIFVSLTPVRFSFLPCTLPPTTHQTAWWNRRRGCQWMNCATFVVDIKGWITQSYIRCGYRKDRSRATFVENVIVWKK